MRIKTGYDLLNRFVKDWREFSFDVAKGRFIRDLPFLPWEKRRSIYENSIIKYLSNNYGGLMNEIKTSTRSIVENPIIWVMWWQGLDKMPDIVRACYRQLLSVANREIVLITQWNYKNWISVPAYVEQRLHNQEISITHFSDIVRLELLKQYGGLWMDATIFAKEIPESIFRSDLYTLHAPGMLPDFIGRGNWSTFFMFSRKTNELLFSRLLRMLYGYWEDHSKIIDYLLLDFLIEIIVNNDPVIKEQICRIPENRDYYLLNLSINDTYIEDTAVQWLKKSPIQKLSYKKQTFLVDNNGRETNYSRLIEGTFVDESDFYYSNESFQANKESTQ